MEANERYGKDWQGNAGKSRLRLLLGRSDVETEQYLLTRKERSDDAQSREDARDHDSEAKDAVFYNSQHATSKSPGCFPRQLDICANEVALPEEGAGVQSIDSAGRYY